MLYKYTLAETILKQTHTLIAGCTGCGKSVLLNDIIYSLPCVTYAGIVLIDPKRVELRTYKRLPHTLLYADTAKEAENVLYKMCVLMDSRYSEMTGKTYNGLPIYIIIDELADLFTADNARTIKKYLQRILQLGRAAGMHVITATQAPNRKIIPAEIVLNYTCRIGLHCLSPIESRQIIGVPGCEQLPKYGNALIYIDGFIKEVKIPYTSDNEIERQINEICRLTRR